MQSSRLVGKKTLLSGLLAVFVCVTAFLVLSGWLPGPRQQSEANLVYYLDTVDNTLFAAPISLNLPIHSPTQDATDPSPRGVRAHVFSCAGRPGDLRSKTPQQVEDSGAFIAYLETHRLNHGREATAGHTGNLPRSGLPNVWVRGIHDTDWYPADSERAGALMRTIKQRCGEAGNPQMCFP